MIQATFTASDIHPALGTADRAAHDFLYAWQAWSDRTFGTIQPHVLAAIESICYVIRWAAAMAWSYSRLACTNTWEAWLESAPQRALALDLMGITWEEIRLWLSVAYSIAAVAVVVTALTGVYLVSNAPRWAGRAIAFALCVSW